MHPFIPTPRQTNFLLVLGFGALALGLLLRQSLRNAEALSVACQAGAERLACGARQFLLELQDLELFGGIALVAAAVHFFRPRMATFAVALAAALLGMMLDNVVPSAFGISILVIAFARSGRAGRQGQAPPVPPPATRPASSRTTH